MHAVLTIIIALLAASVFYIARHFLHDRRLASKRTVRQDIEALIEMHRSRQSSPGAGVFTTESSPPPLPHPPIASPPPEPKPARRPWVPTLRTLLPIAMALPLIAFAMTFLPRLFTTPRQLQPREAARDAGNHPDLRRAAAATPALDLLQVVHHHRGSEVLVEGMVENASTDTLQDIKPIAIFYDVRGEFLTSESGELLFAILPPRDAAPFRIGLRDDPRMGRFEIRFMDHKGGPLTIVDRRVSAHDYINPPPGGRRSRAADSAEVRHASEHR